MEQFEGDTNNGVVIKKEYDVLVRKIDSLWTNAKSRAASAVNTELLDANWETGKYIVEFEQQGNVRAEYGKKLIIQLAKDLTARRGRGFSRSNIIYMRKFYLCFPKGETMSHLLTWSHYFELLKCEDEMERQFYFQEAITQKWKVRELRRQIKSSLFHRIALSSDKKGVLELSRQGHTVMTAEDIIHDPFVLEFTGLEKKRRYKESDLEKALLDNMEKFLLELGRGFAFYGRQYVMPIGGRQFKVDLVFYNCILKCYVLLDLKRNEITHHDIGQMNLYLNYFKTEVCMPDDNPPIGIVLGSRRDEVLMEYALEGITNQLFTARYQLYLPRKEELQAQLDRLLNETEI
ncbi:MAG: PDDEXK nuclease domain-containing protein [Muribaculaceae bacterium]|nr:PDDEXK nuclease domain-containing protein [Muribaculaceae bacterium]